VLCVLISVLHEDLNVDDAFHLPLSPGLSPVLTMLCPYVPVPQEDLNVDGAFHPLYRGPLC